nr:diguanylate cyclase [Marinobacter similis]
MASPDGASARITVSAGVAALSPGEDQDSLFKRADDALYRAKQKVGIELSCRITPR